MKKNYPKLFSFFKPVTFLVVFLVFEFSGFGQSITNVQISDNNICTGTSLKVSFRANNVWFSSFSSNTIYTIALGIFNSDNQSFDSWYEETFQSNPPTNGWPGYKEFSRDFSIPSTIMARNDYQILVYSSNPNVRTTQGLSDVISIYAIPGAPTVGTIAQPSCSVSTGSVTLNGLPSGSWKLTRNPENIITTGTGTTTTISNLSPGTYNYTVSEIGNVIGLRGDYFSNRNLSGTPSLTRTDATINFDWGSGGPGAPIGSDNFSVRWSGQIKPRYSENYTFTTRSDDGIRLWINGKQIINNWTDHAVTPNTGTITLTAGVKYDVVLEYYENGGEAVAQLYWSSPSQGYQIIPQSQLFSEARNCTSSSSETIVINPQPATPAAPVVESIIQPTCTTATGSVALKGLPSGNWTINPGAITGSGTNKTITGLEPGTYNYTVTNASGCVSSASENLVINSQPLKISNNTINYTGETNSVCSENTASPITGSQPTGGDGTYSYLWESSTASASGDFAPAVGINNTLDYNPENLTTTTWFRRVVNSGVCGASTSNVVEVRVNPLPKLTLSSGDNTICLGQTFNLNGTLSGTGPWTVRGTMNGEAFSWSSPYSALSYALSPTVNTIINITEVEDSNGCKNSEIQTITITVLEENIWTGALNSDWNNTANWSCNNIPTLAIDVLIPAGLGNYPEVFTGEANALTRKLTIEAGASVRVNNNWIRVAGDLANSGVFNVENGSISFEGTATQQISSGTFKDDNVLNLNIKNPAGVTSEANIRILNSLKADQGNFETGNSLLLVSNTSGTAYIDGSGAGQVTGTVKMQRYLSNSFGYKYFSTAFQNSTVGDLAANFDLTNSETGFPHLYEYFENRKDILGNDATGWQKYLETNAALKPGLGYAINPNGVADTLTLELSGIVNNGPVNVVLENNGRTYTNGFNLVGNPYPSPLDWDLMVEGLSGIDNAIHFFTATPGDRYTGTYTSFVDGVSTDGRSSSIIPSMQGFFVRVSDPDDGNYPATASLEFTNAARTGNQVTQTYYKTRNKAEVPQIRLSAAFKGENISDATVIYFKNGATSEFEKDVDAQKILNTAIDVPSFYSLTSQQEKLSINAVSGTSMKNMEIPLGISAERSGEMTIALAGTKSLFPSLYIYLKDNKNNVLKDLEKDPIYTFTSQKGENNDRFILLFSSEKLSPAQMTLATEDFMVYTKNDMVWVKLNLPTSVEGKVILSNMLGQAIQSKKGTGNEELNFSGMAAGVYLVTLESRNLRQTKKVIFKE